MLWHERSCAGFFAWGARCWVCAGSDFLSNVHISIYEACVLEGDYTRGRVIMLAMLSFMRISEQGEKFVQSFKYVCEMIGLRPGLPRQPLQQLSFEEMRNLEKVIRNLEI